MALPLATSVTALPDTRRFCSLIISWERLPESCSATRGSRARIQTAAPPVNPTLASSISVLSLSPCASFALITALPRTSCVAKAANGAKSGRRSSTTACCPPAFPDSVSACACKLNSGCIAVSSIGRDFSLSCTVASSFTGSFARSRGCGPGTSRPVTTARTANFPAVAFSSAFNPAIWVPAIVNPLTSRRPSAVSADTDPCQLPCSASFVQARSGRGDIAGASTEYSKSADAPVKSTLPCARACRSPARSARSTRAASRGPCRVIVADRAPSPGNDKRFSSGPLAGSCTTSDASIRFGSSRKCKVYSPSPSNRRAASSAFASWSERNCTLPPTDSITGIPVSGAPSSSVSIEKCPTSICGMETLPPCCCPPPGARSMCNRASCSSST